VNRQGLVAAGTKLACEPVPLPIPGPRTGPRFITLGPEIIPGLFLRDGSIDPGVDEDRWPRRRFGARIEIGEISGVSSYPVIERLAGLVSSPIAIERRNLG